MKIPVGRTIEGAYSFALSNFLNIVGIAWFPFTVLILLVGGMGATMAGKAAMAGGAQMDPAVAASAGFFGLLVLVAFIVMSAMVNVGILRQALGMHKGAVFFYFSLGAPVWRMIGAMFLGVIAVFGIGIACAIVGGIVWYAASMALSGGALSLVGTVVIIAGFCVYIYSAVRILYLLPAVVVAEGHIDIGEAWRLTAGSFWRIVVITIAVIFPVIIVFTIVFVVINGAAMIPMMQQAAANPNGTAAIPPQMSIGIMVADFALYLAYLIMLTGLSSGACAVAYLGASGKSEA